MRAGVCVLQMHLCSPFRVARRLTCAMPGYWGNTCHVWLTRLLALCTKVAPHSLRNTGAVSWTLSCLLRLLDSRCRYLADVANQTAWVVSKSIQIKTKLSRSAKVFSGGIQPANLGPSPKSKVKCKSLTLSVAVKCFKGIRHAPNCGPWVRLLSGTGLDADLWVLLSTCLL